MAKYEDYLIHYDSKTEGKGTRDFDWCDFDMLEECNETTRDKIAAKVEARGKWYGRWGREDVMVTKK